jgi:hypothetical protein
MFSRGGKRARHTFTMIVGFYSLLVDVLQSAVVADIVSTKLQETAVVLNTLGILSGLLYKVGVVLIEFITMT